MSKQIALIHQMIHQDPEERALHVRGDYELYFIIPLFDFYQDDLVPNIPRKPGFSLRKIAQQDGSRLTVLKAKLSAVALMRELQEGHFRYYSLLTKSFSETRPVQGTRIYVIWLHTYLNGVRVLPVLVTESADTYSDLSPLFPDKMCIDGLGIIVDYNDDGPILQLPPEYTQKPILVNYLPKMKMCHCCGIVSDITKPRKQPWYTVK